MAIDRGDAMSTEALLPLVYQEMRKLAAAKLSNESSGLSLQPTELVHEAFLRLVDVDQPPQWSGRGHFFGAAAEAMRRILIERARRKHAEKRGGGRQKVDLESVSLCSWDADDELLAINEVLTLMEERLPEAARLVKLRYFAGLTMLESAQALNVSLATAERRWTFAKAWLHSKLKKDQGSADSAP